jgi:hypothetical protein
MLVLHTSTGPVSDDSNDHASALCWRQWWWCTHHRRYSRLVMLSRLLRSVSPAPPRCRWGCCPTDSHLVLSDGPTLDVQRARACEHGHPAPSTTTAGGCPRACMGCDISPPRAAGALTSLLSDTGTPYQGLMAQRLPRWRTHVCSQRLLLADSVIMRWSFGLGRCAGRISTLHVD